mmetsp:Transcript_19791/g.19902  ORF Transcript_19791/g.19902 Transcript_19791/m.19902 type:complete len:217 (+) Transcript_19791:42-692(+)
MVAIALSEPIVSALRVAGPAFFLGMQGSCIRTATQIVKEKSVGKLSPLPFVSLLTNCVIWTYYGALRSDFSILIPNAVGIFSGIGCATAFHKNTPSIPNNEYVVSATIIAICSYLALKGNYQLLGSIGCGLAVFLMASPLATIKTVLRDKTTAAMPFPISFLGWLNAASWSAYGLLVAHDVMVYGPNLAGFVLASLQMMMFVIFGLPPRKQVKAMF